MASKHHTNRNRESKFWGAVTTNALLQMEIISKSKTIFSKTFFHCYTEGFSAHVVLWIAHKRNTSPSSTAKILPKVIKQIETKTVIK